MRTSTIWQCISLSFALSGATEGDRPRINVGHPPPPPEASTLHQRRGIRARRARFAVSFSPRTAANRVLSAWSNRVFPVAPPTRRRPGPAFVCTRLPNPADGARAFDFFTSRRDHWFRRRPRRKSAEWIRAQVDTTLFADLPHLPRLLSNFFCLHPY